MPNRKLETFDEYRYGPKSVLNVGDRFRVGGGPVYVTADGVQHKMAERGIFKFRRYCVLGAQKWIEASAADGSGTVALWVGKSGRSPVVENLRRKPYTVRKIQERKRNPDKKKNARRKAKTAHKPGAVTHSRASRRKNSKSLTSA